MEKLRVKDYQYTEILLKPFKSREFDLGRKALVILRTDTGDLEITLEEGFWFNGRSGPNVIDHYIPHLGSTDLAVCFLVHDALGHDVCYSFESVNGILHDMLVIAGYHEQADTVQKAVSISDDWFGCKTDKERDNKAKIRVEWVPRSKQWRRSKAKRLAKMRRIQRLINEDKVSWFDRLLDWVF